MRPNTEISISGSGLHRPLLFLLLLLLLDFASSSFHPSPLLGVAPQDEEYYASEVIACRDGSRSFGRDRLNDGFCDCPDGTDEPGTSACPESKFYCKNLGDRTRILFSSRVNDQICDCCDGSDEYDGRIICADTCSKKDIIAAVMKAKNAHDMETENSGQLSVFENDTTIGFKENIESIKDLRIAIILEIVVAASLLTCCIFHWWTRYNRRHRRLKI